MKYIYIAVVVFSCFGCDICANDESELYTAIEEGNTPKVNTILSNKKTDPNTMLLDWSTPLHVATKNNQEASVELLLQYGANPNFVDKHEKTPLQYAIEKSYYSIITMLVAKNAEFTNIEQKDLKHLDPPYRDILIKFRNDAKAKNLS